MLGHKQLSRSQLGNRNMKNNNALGNRLHYGNNKSNFNTPNISGGINNTSNSDAVSRMPMIGISRRENTRHANVEKPRPPGEKSSKFA
jgi:hypothetical protein